MVADSNGGTYSTQLYRAFGEVRPGGVNTLATRYTFTGQADDGYINLMWYRSRWYDQSLGRFIQPDTIVPLSTQGVQAWDRYAYANNNAVRYNDPSGHTVACDESPTLCGGNGSRIFLPSITLDGSNDTPSGSDDSDTLPAISAPNPYTPVPPVDPEYERRQDISKKISQVVIIIDGVALIVSGIEAVVVDILGIAAIGFGVAATATGIGSIALGPAIAYTWSIDFAMAGVSPFAAIENSLGAASFVLTAIGDVFAGNTGFIENGFAIGNDTRMSAGTTAAGFIPEANIDLGASLAQFVYDYKRMDGTIPTSSIIIYWGD